MQVKINRNEAQVRAAALALLLLALVAPAGADTVTDNEPPDLGSCPKLQVPAGNDIAFHVYAEGLQIYRWDGTSWAFVAPVALLFADPAGTDAVGFHFAGPTWESIDGSKVAGMVMERCTPEPTAIPWLLLGAVSHAGPGIFAQVTYVQRVNTVGGTAPTAPGQLGGRHDRVADQRGVDVAKAVDLGPAKKSEIYSARAQQCHDVLEAGAPGGVQDIWRVRHGVQELRRG